MNKADMARAIVVFEELASALRAELLGAAADEHAQGSTPSWRMTDVTVSTALSKPSVVVEDPAAFLAYVGKVHPTEVETVTTTQVRPNFSRLLLANLATAGPPLVDDEGTVIPGVRYDPGGQLRSVAVKPSAEFKSDAVRFALEVAAGQRPLTLPSIGAIGQETAEPAVIDASEPASDAAWEPSGWLVADPWEATA